MKRAQIPYVTIFLIGMNVGIFLAIELLGSTADSDLMVRYGAMRMPEMLEDHSYWRLFTSMFLHFGTGHIISNMVSLLVVGISLEREEGSLRFALTYLISGVLGNVISLIYDHIMNINCISAGASGAIYGVFGAMLVTEFVISREKKKDLLRILCVGVLLFMWNDQKAGSVDYAAHLGGFLTGGLIQLVAMGLGRKKKGDE